MANVLDKIARFHKIRAGYIREIAPASAGQGLNYIENKKVHNEYLKLNPFVAKKKFINLY